IARALEITGVARGDPPAGLFSQGWWAARLLPLLVTFFYAGDALNRGQSTPILLLCLAGAGAAILRGRSFSAGLWLGAAGILKLFPLYLLIYPLLQRDRRFLGGAALAIAVGIALRFAIMALLRASVRIANSSSTACWAKRRAA